MAKIFTDILAQGIRQGRVPAREKQARDWYRETAKDASVTERQMFRSGERKTQRPLNGNMYMFNYYAKGRDTLQYYDQFPLIFPYRRVKGGFYGINMHYLPHMLRAKLMDALYDTATNESYDETTRLQINYSILSSASKFSAFKPCIKRYLNSQVISPFIYVYPSEWDIALFLPLESFTGASKRKVWADSRKIIQGS